MAQPFKILLYYKYTSIQNPLGMMATQRELCQRLNIKGRILLSTEGINGTVAGLENDISEYVRETEKQPDLGKIEWKISWADEQVFPKLKVKVRDEIVTLGVKKSGADVSIENKADYIEPQELRELYEKNEDFVIIDARNMYEAEIGKFKNSVIPPIDNFRDFPAFAKSLEEYKDKEVVTYCTGGVRCEKASAYLRENGFKKVRQLHGGIHEYGEQAEGKYFEGEMFVFDKRLHVPINKVNPETISHCQFCQTKITRFVDCVAKTCDSLFICCEDCEKKHQSTCSDKCLSALFALST